MPVSPFLRRGTSLVVLAGYLLAATVSGMFHRHGDESGHPAGCGAGCGERCRTQAGPADSHRSDVSATTKRCRHGHNHHHDAADSAETPDQAGNSSQHQSPRHGPLRHDNCAACQFLAQMSLAAPTLVFVPCSTAVAPVAPAFVAAVPAVVADAHPARGPPCHG